MKKRSRNGTASLKELNKVGMCVIIFPGHNLIHAQCFQYTLRYNIKGSGHIEGRAYSVLFVYFIDFVLFGGGPQ